MQYTGSMPVGMIIPICPQSVDIKEIRKKFPDAGLGPVMLNPNCGKCKSVDHRSYQVECKKCKTKYVAQSYSSNTDSILIYVKH